MQVAVQCRLGALYMLLRLQAAACSSRVVTTVPVAGDWGVDILCDLSR